MQDFFQNEKKQWDKLPNWNIKMTLPKIRATLSNTKELFKNHRPIRNRRSNVPIFSDRDSSSGAFPVWDFGSESVDVTVEGLRTIAWIELILFHYFKNHDWHWVTLESCLFGFGIQGLPLVESICWTFAAEHLLYVFIS